MKIFRVEYDVNKYQSILSEDDSIWSTDRLIFDGRAKYNSWLPPAVYYPNPLKKLGDFVYLCPGTLVFNEKARKACATFFEMSGEILPLPHEEAPLFALNVTECWNVLDQNKTEWQYDRSGTIKLHILNFFFHRHRIPEVPLFKIPETVRGDIYTVEGMKAPEDEFKYTVESNGLKGLIFEEVWDGERC